MNFISVDSDADHAELDEHDADEEEDDDDDAPPEEFSSVPQKQFGLEEEEDEDETQEFENDDEARLIRNKLKIDKLLKKIILFFKDC